METRKQMKSIVVFHLFSCLFEKKQNLDGPSNYHARAWVILNH